MAAGEVHVGDTGVSFDRTVKNIDGVVDISGATVKQFLFERPDKSTLEKAADFINTGTDGQLRYNTVSGDLTVAGIWKIQVYLVLGGDNFRSDVSTFEVFENVTTNNP